MTTIVVILLLTLVGAGVGFAVGTLLVVDEIAEPAAAMPGKNDENATAHEEPAGKASHTPDVAENVAETEVSPDDFKVIPFPPVLTTLAEPKGKWIRLEGSILARSAGEKAPERLAEEAGEQILTYLRSVRLGQLESASGILGLRDDLNDTVRTLSDGDVQGVLIHGLVVE